MSDAFMIPGVTRSDLTLSLVISLGSNSCVGVLKSVVLGAASSPDSSFTATSAAAAATISLGLEIVLYGSPATISCTPAKVASLPVTGGTGLTPAALNAAIV